MLVVVWSGPNSVCYGERGRDRCQYAELKISILLIMAPGGLVDA